MNGADAERANGERGAKDPHGASAERQGFAGRVIRLLASALPQLVRGRYREEWLADLAGAEELGLSRGSIVLGALATTVSIDRDSPVVLGIPISIEAVRRARWAAACLTSSALLLIGLWWNGGFALDDLPGMSGLEWLGRFVGAVAAVLATAGVWQVFRAILIGVDAYGPKRVVLAGVGLAACVLGLLLVLIVPLLGLLYGFGGLVAALVLAAGGPRGAVPTEAPRPLHRVLLALPFALVALAMLAVVMLHVYIWNPLAKLPGMTLDEIYAQMRDAGETPVVGVIVGLTVLALLLVLSPPVLAPTRALAGPRSTRRIVVLGLLSIAAASWIEFFFGFGMGMGIADTFGTDGVDAAPSGLMISIAGQFALVAAVFAGLAPAARSRFRGLPAAGDSSTGTSSPGAPASALT